MKICMCYLKDNGLETWTVTVVLVCLFIAWYSTSDARLITIIQNIKLTLESWVNARSIKGKQKRPDVSNEKFRIILYVYLHGVNFTPLFLLFHHRIWLIGTHFHDLIWQLTLAKNCFAPAHASREKMSECEQRQRHERRHSSISLYRSSPRLRCVGECLGEWNFFFYTLRRGSELIADCGNKLPCVSDSVSVKRVFPLRFHLSYRLLSLVDESHSPFAADRRHACVTCVAVGKKGEEAKKRAGGNKKGCSVAGWHTLLGGDVLQRKCNTRK